MSETTNNLSQALVSSMEILAKSGDQALSFDKTIECTVVKAVDPATGEYKVRYLNGTISAYDISLEMKYKVNDEVYVQVPQNDMALKKLIVGKKSTKASDLIDVVLDTERVDKLGLPLESIYNLPIFSKENGIIGSTISNRNYYTVLYDKTDNIINDADKLLQNYAANQTLLLIESKFKTSWFERDLSRGNYGLEFIFNLKDNAGQYAIILDCQSMRGNSFLYNDWTTVTGLLTIEGDKIESLEAVRFFSEDFIRKNYNESELQEKERNGEYEIFVKDISVSFVQEAETLGYTVNIRTPDGIYFTAISAKKDDLRLQALFKYNGQELKTNKAKYYWYRRNSTIGTAHPQFDELAGVGWEKLEGDTSLKILTLDEFGRTSISQLYKVIVTYEDYVCDNEVLIFRTTDSDNYELYLTKDTNNIGKLTLRKSNSDEIVTFDDGSVFEWLSINNNGLTSYYTEEAGENNTNTHISADGLSLNNIYLDNIIGFTTYYCSVFSSNNVPIITIYKTVQNIQVLKDFDVTFIIDNDGFYSYNTKGDYISDVLQKSIDFTINWKDEPMAYYYQWVPTTDIEKDEDGKEFLSYKNKMFEGVSTTLDGEVDPNLENSSVNQTYYFKVKNRYHAEKAENNIIQLNIIIDGITYTFRKNLIFLKEGSSGTNGTSLMLKVEPAEDSNVALMPNENSSIVLKCTLYYNGQTTYGNNSICQCFDVEGSVPYDYWSQVTGTDILLNPLVETVTTIDDEGKEHKTVEEQITIKRINKTDTEHIWIEVKTKKNLTYNLNEVGPDGGHFNSIIQLKFYPNGTSESFNYNLYKLYAIPLVQISNTSNANIAKYFVTGAKEVLYDSNGYNPQYAETEYKIYADTTVTDLTQPVTFGFYQDSEGFSVSNKTLIPWTYFDKSQRGAIYFSFNNSDYYAQPIIFATNLFSENLLNAWDGTSLQIDDKNSTVLASQIGAGKKDSDNKFTGVLMGQYSTISAGRQLSETGLLGFYKGDSTFGLLDSGDAYFGRSGFGRIEFITSNNTALIQSGGYIPAASSGVEITYVEKESDANPTFSISKPWTEVPTANMVISFVDNGITNRGKNLNNFYYSVGAASEQEGTISNYSFFKIKLKEVDKTTQEIISYYQDVDDKGVKTYKKIITNQIETVVKELNDGGWKSSRDISSSEAGEATTIEEEEYLKGPPEPTKSSESYHYYLYVYEKSSTVVPFEYIRFTLKNGEVQGAGSQVNSADELYLNEQFTIHTTAAQGQGMQINLTTGQIDAADFKLQSKTILINSQIKYYCDNELCENYNKHLLLGGTCKQCGNDLIPYLGDYAIKVGSDANAFFIRHDGTGMIGGWTINKNSEGIWSLYAGDTYLSSAGEITGARLQGGTISGSAISGSSVYATYLDAYAGNIGGWTIERGGLSSGAAYLYSNGSLQMGSGNFMTTISGSGVQIGNTMAITSSTISMYAGSLLDGTNLYFFLGYGGIELVHSKSYNDTDSKLKLGWDPSDSGTNVYPYLRLGAGSGSPDTTFWLKKYTSYWWMGNVSGNTGIKINTDKTVEIVGTAKIYATLA